VSDAATQLWPSIKKKEDAKKNFSRNFEKVKKKNAHTVLEKIKIFSLSAEKNAHLARCAYRPGKSLKVDQNA